MKEREFSMEEKSILIQSDEVTKNIMGEIQDDMINAISKLSKNMFEEVIEKLRPIEKKINDLRGNLEEFQEEEFEVKIEELSSSISKLTQSIESSIDVAINKSITEQNNVLFKSIEERLAILGLKVVKDAASNKEAILNKISTIQVEKVEEKVESLDKSIEVKVNSLEKSIESNLDISKDIILGKIKNIDNKIEDKEIIIELINKLEENINRKVDNIQEEVEWGNRSFFAKLFGKRRE